MTSPDNGVLLSVGPHSMEQFGTSPVQRQCLAANKLETRLFGQQRTSSGDAVAISVTCAP